MKVIHPCHQSTTSLPTEIDRHWQEWWKASCLPYKSFPLLHSPGCSSTKETLVQCTAIVLKPWLADWCWWLVLSRSTASRVNQVYCTGAKVCFVAIVTMACLNCWQVERRPFHRDCSPKSHARRMESRWVCPLARPSSHFQNQELLIKRQLIMVGFRDTCWPLGLLMRLVMPYRVFFSNHDA